MNQLFTRASTRHRWAVALFALALLAAADDRLPYSVSSPGWLLAVGSLRVPGVKLQGGYRRHYREDCSATLVASVPGRAADIVVTAWHCLELYTDLSRPILFTLRKGLDRQLVQEARLLAHGGGMHADWAILRLAHPVPADRVAALTLHPGHADPDRPIIMAGYSRDGGLGAYGEQLTYDPTCSILRQSPGAGDSDCAAYRGASGGAVIQLSPQGEPQLAGVISRGDSRGMSIFMPIDGFRGTLRRFLK
jgi:hypothetical protein